MYKVFLNDRLINIGAPGKITITKPTLFFDRSVAEAAIKNWFENFKDSKLGEVYLLHPEPDLFFEKFRSIFREIPAAGGVVVANGRLLFIYRRGKWDLPKGKIDPGEAPEEAAVREVEEECGISGPEITKPLPFTYHIYSSPGRGGDTEWIFKKTFWFEMTYRGDQAVTPQKEEDITEVKWIPEHELGIVFSNTFQNLKQLISLYRS